MKTLGIFLMALVTVFLASQASAVLSSGPGGNGVSVGSSSLISQLDYSDSWTEGINGRVANGAFPVGVNQGPAALLVENNDGNTVRSWSDRKWSFNKDSFTAGAYPGGNGAGSATGITQTGAGGEDWGIEYGVRRDYTVQFDAVQTSDRIDITTGAVRDTIFNAGNVSFFFRAGGGFPSIGIYNGALETDTGFTTGLGAGEIGRWHNYAVHFDLTGGLADLYVDEGLRGTINLATFSGGAYSAILLPTGNAAVTVGYAGSGGVGGTWTDNFQVGFLTVPEPSTTFLLRMGGLVLVVYRRRRV